MENEWISESEDDTMRAGEALARAFRGGEIVFLEGSLGMGKTVFAKGVARGLDIDEKEVTSPSFIVLREHRGRLRLFHIDLYRIDDPAEMERLGLEDFLGDEDAVAVVEWGEKLSASLLPPPPASTVKVRIEDLGGSRRRILCTVQSSL
jgi:tRNA threonylcarbamoyladenosine biosynthesis protein TsaE